MHRLLTNIAQLRATYAPNGSGQAPLAATVLPAGWSTRLSEPGNKQGRASFIRQHLTRWDKALSLPYLLAE
jgi:hypothetical protein